VAVRTAYFAQSALPSQLHGPSARPMVKPPDSFPTDCPKCLDAYLEEHPEDAGAGLSDRVADFDTWRPGEYDPDDDPWVDALQCLDEQRDKTKLVDLLRSNQTLPPYSRRIIADLIERHQLRQNPGRPRTPLYNRSKADEFWDYACAEVKRATAEFGSDEEAIDGVARQLGIGANKLWNAYKGKRGSSNRIKKRRNPKG